MSGLDEFRKRYRHSLEAFIKGDPEPQKALWSRSDDVTPANPLGPPAKGLEQVFRARDSAAAAVRHLVHRHADPITRRRPVESVADSSRNPAP